MNKPVQATLASLEEWFVVAMTSHDSQVVVLVENASQTKQIKVVFSDVYYLKFLRSSAKEAHKDNEVWKFMEVEHSDLLKGINIEAGNYWLKVPFAGSVQSQRAIDPANLRQIVLLSDYIHFELVCSTYQLLMESP